jgi:hypothetical protein
LKDKKYADFTESYSQGLQDLIRSLIPKNASSPMLNNLGELQLYLLPAFSHGELVIDHDLNLVIQAINVLEVRSGLPITDFNLMRKCQVAAARYINQLMDPIKAIRRLFDLADTWVII